MSHISNRASLIKYMYIVQSIKQSQALGKEMADFGVSRLTKQQGIDILICFVQNISCDSVLSCERDLLIKRCAFS